MKKNEAKLVIRTSRCFSEEFKKSKVKELIEKRKIALEATRMWFNKNL